MLSLRRRIDRYESLLSLLASGPSAQELAGLRGDRATEYVQVSVDLRTVLYALRDEIENVANLTRALLRHLMAVDASPITRPLNPSSPDPDMARRVEKEAISRAEAIDWALGNAG
jgi:hypothetical protein